MAPREVTLADHINNLLPTNGRKCPIWPPDLFAVMASLAERTGFYAEPGITLSTSARGRKLKQALAERNKNLGEHWRTTGVLPPRVQELWRRLIQLGNCPVFERHTSRSRLYKRLAGQLLAVADEASEGCGFRPQANNQIAQIAFGELVSSLRGKPTLLRCPSSICLLVDPDLVCVMPKSLTPTVGCTLRSLSHHLALLPGRGSVQAEWYINVPTPNEVGGDEGTTEFNILVIPYPYYVSRTDFQPAKPADSVNRADGYFELKQGWLDGKTEKHREDFAEFLVGLVHAATALLNSGVVHAVVLPETALDDEFAQVAFRQLQENFPKLEALIVGVLLPGSPLSENVARLYLARADTKADQRKHHRWALTGGQIRQYQLSRSLKPEDRWWENIDVSNRKLRFALLRTDVVMCSLVCEDLARFEPVLPVINAIGPNLVVALLMDGPQLQSRWPGRYATVLADDPGSSVLTVTSLGMARLARRPGEAENRVIALWKDSSGSPASELHLPIDAHALLLCLKSEDQDGVTMDLRRDGNASVSLLLKEVWPVSMPNAPFWLSQPH